MSRGTATRLLRTPTAPLSAQQSAVLTSHFRVSKTPSGYVAQHPNEPRGVGLFAGIEAIVLFVEIPEQVLVPC